MFVINTEIGLMKAGHSQENLHKEIGKNFGWSPAATNLWEHQQYLGQMEDKQGVKSREKSVAKLCGYCQEETFLKEWFPFQNINILNSYAVIP